MWTVRARNADLTVAEPVAFSSLSLVERYNQPDTCVLQGRSRDLAALATPGMGALLFDGSTQRVSMLVTDIQRRGDGTTQITLTSDLVRLWDRICYPNPAQAFISQTRDYDVRTGARETVALAYINANAGPGALTARQVPRLRVPGTLGRGGSTSNRARFDNLGQLVASLMEPAGLRLRVVHTSNGPGPGYLDVVFDTAPDISAWARYGTPNSGGPGLLSKDWSFGLTAPTLTTAEVAAGGTGAARLLEEQAFTTQEAMWGRRVEGLVDQRQTTDSTEINQAGYDALMEGMTGTAVDVKVLNSAGLTLGVDVPLGALVSASLDGLVVKERIREVSTTVAAEGGGATVTVEPLFGSTDTTGQTKWQRELVKALRRISVIERTL
jgi:hypothetical protein